MQPRELSLFLQMPHMVNGYAIFAGIVVALFGTMIYEPLQKRRMYHAALAVAALSTLGALYCLLCGTLMWGDYQDPFANASQEALSSASVRGRGRGGLFIVAARYWPYVLMASGLFFGFAHGVGLLRLWARVRRRPATA